jgi:hypothetical protein
VGRQRQKGNDVSVLGPTNEYPQGQIGPDDDGDLTLAIGTSEGLVRIELGTSVAWLAMPPDDARAMAASLLHMAERAESETI